jgi:hypothetical protein
MFSSSSTTRIRFAIEYLRGAVSGRKRIIASARSGFNERRNRGRRLGSADDEAGYSMQKFEVFDVTPSTSA